jgi:uncharacterized membrane protein (DUF485 family)
MDDAPSTVPVARSAEFERIEREPDFRALLAAKARFIVPATIFFVVYYFLLPVLVGYAPGLMETKVFGDVNVAYLFALSQFVVAWVIMALYVRRAKVFDAMAAAIVKRIASMKRGNAS